MGTLIYHFNLKKKKRGETIYKEGEKGEFMYVVKSGEVKLTKEV